jgi:hypothetical protein
LISDDCCAEVRGFSGEVDPNRDISVTYQVANPMDVLSAATSSFRRGGKKPAGGGVTGG